MEDTWLLPGMLSCLLHPVCSFIHLFIQHFHDAFHVLRDAYGPREGITHRNSVLGLVRAAGEPGQPSAKKQINKAAEKASFQFRACGGF